MAPKALVLMGMLSMAACASEDPGVSAAATADTVDAILLVMIGEIDGTAEYLFGDVMSVHVGPEEVLYVADRFGSTVRAYDLEGRYLSTVGVEGDGPGEFETPNDIATDDDGRLYVRSRGRVTVMGPRDGGPVRDSVLRTFPLGGPADESWRAKTDGSLYYSPSYYYFMFFRHAYFYVVHDADGPTGDTVHVPVPDPTVLGRANYLVPSGDYGLQLDGVSLAPFEGRPWWDVTERGTVFVAAANAYEVAELSAEGDTLRVIRRPVAARPVPAAEHRDSARAFQERLDSIPVSLDDVNGMSGVAQARIVPEVLPEIIGLQVAADGSLWVRRWPGPDGNAVFDVLDESGALLRTVRVPARLSVLPPPYVSARFIAGVVTDPETAIERVAVFELGAG